MAKRGLGRGLDALLGGSHAASKSNENQAVGAGLTANLAVDLVQRGRFQPRRQFDEDRLQELADSISAQGVVQPVVVRSIEGGRYELIAGERRWRAAQIAGLAEIPAIIKEVDDQAAMAMGLIENIQRDDLNPLEEAQALHRLLEEFGLTHQQVAQAVGKSRTTVTNLMRLLDLDPRVKAHVEQGELEMGHARALLSLDGDVQAEVAEQVVNRGLSVRETEALVRRYKDDGGAKPTQQGKPEDDPDVRRLLQNLTERLGAKVQIKQTPGGKGKLVISYNNLDELEGIMAHIQ